MHQEKSQLGRYLLGTGVILFGVAMFFSQTFHFHFDIWDYFWEALLIFIGILVMVNSSSKWLGVVLIAIGGLNLLGEVFHFNFWDYFWSLVLIGIGILIIFNKKVPRGHHRQVFHPKEETIRQGLIDETVLFSGGKKFIQSETFTGGSVSIIFGGLELDLMRCKLAPGENILDVTTIFGGIEIFVPREWKVDNQMTAIFGGFSDKRSPLMLQDPQTHGTLIIKGVAVFGGGELKAY